MQLVRALADRSFFVLLLRQSASVCCFSSAKVKSSSSASPAIAAEIETQTARISLRNFNFYGQLRIDEASDQQKVFLKHRFLCSLLISGLLELDVNREPEGFFRVNHKFLGL